MALTKKDIQLLQEYFATKNDVQDIVKKEITKKFEEKLKYLPTKEEFYNKMDELLKEFRDLRDEVTVNVYRVSEHEDRIRVLEEKTNIIPN